MTEKLKNEILALELDPAYEEDYSDILDHPDQISPIEFADMVSCAVTDLEHKLRLLCEFRETTEMQSNDEMQHEMDTLNNTCQWLQQVISQFHQPSAQSVMMARLMGFQRRLSGKMDYDALVTCAGPFPIPNGDAALNAIRAYDIGLDGETDDLQYWEIQIYDFSNETSHNKFMDSSCTYLVTLDGVVAYYRDDQCFSENHHYFDAGFFEL